MPNLAQSLGEEYFSDRMHGVLFVHEGRVLSVASYNRTRNVLACEVAASATNADVGSSVAVDADLVRNYDDVATPPLGYVRAGENLYRTSRVSNGRGAGGFVKSSAKWKGTPLTETLRTAGALTRQPELHVILQSIYFPSYDTMSRWDEMVSGDISGLLLSRDVVIEPSVRVNYDAYDVLVKGVVVGSLNPNRSINRYTPKENRPLIMEILQQ